MESVKEKNPKDDQIINKDNRVTNKDDEDRSKNEEKEAADKHVLTMISDNDSPGILGDESASNKGQGPAGENL